MTAEQQTSYRLSIWPARIVVTLESKFLVCLATLIRRIHELNSGPTHGLATDVDTALQTWFDKLPALRHVSSKGLPRFFHHVTVQYGLVILRLAGCTVVHLRVKAILINTKKTLAYTTLGSRPEVKSA